ncbi:thaumatin-like protein 1 [Pyrus communis]|uniref:thaumatin-like protein 1 n=1 Tax=Pyrus communis TaxID=23211 RepID=UPI0035C086CD
MGLAAAWLGLGASLFCGLEVMDRVPGYFFHLVPVQMAWAGTALKLHPTQEHFAHQLIIRILPPLPLPPTPTTTPSSSSSSFSSSTLTSFSHTTFAICRLCFCVRKKPNILCHSRFNPISYHFTFILLIITKGVLGATFTFTNKSDFTVWPGILASSASYKLDSTGFELPKGSSRVFQAPTGWSGRFWGRTGCSFDGSGRGSCSTGDCASGELECNGAGAAPPPTLAEFTLGSGSQDLYHVSLVDGYNLPMIVEGSGGTGACPSTGCVTDLNRRCPAELKDDMECSNPPNAKA